MKNYSFLIISLFLSSTQSYGHELKDHFNSLDTGIINSTDPVAYIKKNIKFYDGLVSYMLKNGEMPWVIETQTDQSFLEYCQTMLERLKSRLYEFESH